MININYLNKKYSESITSLKNNIIEKLPIILEKEDNILIGGNPFNPNHITIIERNNHNIPFNNENYQEIELLLKNTTNKVFLENLKYHMNAEIEYNGSYFYFIDDENTNPQNIAYIKIKDADIYDNYSYITENQKEKFKTEYGIDFRKPENILSIFSALHELSHARDIQREINTIIKEENNSVYLNENDADFCATLFLLNKFNDKASKEIIFQEILSIRGITKILSQEYCQENNIRYKGTHDTIKSIKKAYEISIKNQNLSLIDINEYSNLETFNNMQNIIDKKNKRRIKPH